MKIDKLFNNIITNNKVGSAKAFGEVIRAKLEDALEVRKVGLTSQIFNKATVKESTKIEEAFASVQVIDPIDAANGLKKAGVRSARPSKKFDDEVEFDLKDKKKAVAWMLKHGFDKEDMEDVYPELFESNDLDEAKLEKPKGTPLEIQNQLGTMIAKAKTIKGISDDEYVSWYSNLDDKTYDRWEKMVKADPQYKKAYKLGTQGGSDKPPFPKGTFAAAIWSNEYAAGAMDS